MSGTMGDTTGSLANEGQDGDTRLLDADGRAINRSSSSAGGRTPRSVGDSLDEFEAYVRQQPFSAALIAMGIGYILGRLRII